MPENFPLYTGLIRERNWNGTDGMADLRTIKEPKQAIPTFTETLDLLMKVRAALRTSSFRLLDNVTP
jgi:hypothetical protein